MQVVHKTTILIRNVPSSLYTTGIMSVAGKADQFEGKRQKAFDHAFRPRTISLNQALKS